MIKKNIYCSSLFSLFVLSLFFALSRNVYAQPATGAAPPPEEVSWPHRLTLGLGAGLNLNFASGAYTIGAPSTTYNKGFGAAPTFFALLEIPLSDKWMLVPRIHYSDYSAS